MAIGPVAVWRDDAVGDMIPGRQSLSHWEQTEQFMPISGRERKTVYLLVLVITILWTGTASAQDTEPRRWTSLPTGLNFIGVGYAYTDGDILFDPVLRIEDATFELHTGVLSYIRTLAIAGKSARVDFNLPYAAGRWEGLVDGEYVAIRRRGPGDARVRVSVLLYGAPAETPQEFAKSAKGNTVIGAAVAVTMPTGDYNSGRLINLGANRWVLRPQLGVTHRRGKWTGELTGSVFLYSDNDHFWQESRLVTNPLIAVQAHLIYTFRPGLWASLSTAYGWGGEATINGKAKDNATGNWLNALSFGMPVNRTQTLKFSWVRARTQRLVGADTDSLLVAYSVMF